MTIAPRGLGLLVAAVGLLGCGFVFGYPELVTVAATALVAVAFAVGYVAWRPELSVVREVDPDRVMRGESSQVGMTVGNASRMRAATLIAYDRCGGAQVPVPLLRLRAGKATTVGYPVPTARRGVVTIGPLQVLRQDPLGLVTMARSHGGTDKVWVYPRVHPLVAVPTGIARSLDGLIDRVPHGTITFDTLREYVIGDELRHVHWRTTARVGELMVREHLDTSLPRLVVLLDDRAVAYPDRDGEGSASFESACEAAASVVMSAARAELPVACRLVSGAVAETSGRDRDLSPYLDLLAEAALRDGPGASGGGRGTARRDEPLAAAVSRLRHRSAGDTLIFVTGPGRTEDFGQISTLRGRYPTIVVGAMGGDDETPAATEGVFVLAAAGGAEFAAAWDGVPGW